MHRSGRSFMGRCHRAALTSGAACLLATVIAVPASASPQRCGSIAAYSGARVAVYQVKGSLPCSRVRAIARGAIGSRCEGEQLSSGYRCVHGAPAVGAPARAEGFTLRRGRSVIAGKTVD